MLTPQRLLLLAPLTSAPNRQLVTAASAKAEAAALASLSDDAVDALLLAASDAIANYCFLPMIGADPPTFARQSIVETQIFPADPYPALPQHLFLAHWPIALTALTIDGEIIDLLTVMAQPHGQIGFLPGADYRYWPANVVIEAQYAAGYVTASQSAIQPTPPTGPSLPADLARAVVATAQNIQSQQARTQFDVASVEETDSDAGSIATRYFQAGKVSVLPGEAVAILESYRRLT